MLRGVLLRRARMLGGRQDSVNVIQRADRLSSLEASLILRENGMDPVWHVVSRGRARAEIREEISRAARGGIRSTLCIRGDQSILDQPDTPKVREAVAMVLEGMPDALVGVTMNQYASHERVLKNLIPKLRAGAAFVQTQPVFSLEPYLALADAVKSRSAETRILPMVMPLVSTAAVESMRTRLGLRVPEDLFVRLEKGGESAGWEGFADTVATLFESPLADGIAVMTLEMDPPKEFADRIVSELVRACRL